jgi:capsid protein
VAQAFSTAARNQAVVANLLHQERLPAAGVNVESARLSTGATVGMQASKGASITNTDGVEALVTGVVALIEGQVNVSQQLLDPAERGSTIDVLLGADLGEALGLKLDEQVLYGTGSNQQLRGLAAVSGIVDITKTNASPTGATNLLALGDLTARVAAALGRMPDTLLLHPRRVAYIRSKLANTIEWPAAPVAVPALRSSLGSGTNADEAFAIAVDEIWLLTEDPPIRFDVFFDPSGATGSASLTAKFSARMYASLLAGRKVQAIGRATGTESSAPVFT